MAGLRERKKEQTRRLIAETARQLFSERGFEHVTIAEIAEAAEVAVQTVFNYFPTKEDLVYWRLASFEGELLAAVREREPGQSALEAFKTFLLAQQGLLGRGDQQAREELALVHAHDHREPRAARARGPDPRRLHRRARRACSPTRPAPSPATCARASRPAR